MVIDRISESEFDAVTGLIQKVFDHYVAPDITPAGIREFKDFASADSLRGRINTGSLVLVAKCRGTIAGMIEMKFGRHISLLFTAAEFQRQGVAKALLAAGIAFSRRNKLRYDRITVNSSPYAVEIYKKMGFIPLATEQAKYGIRFTPMAKLL